MLAAARRLNYASVRWLLAAWAKPEVNGVEHGVHSAIVYALANRSVADIALLDIIAERHGLPAPLGSLEAVDEARSFFFLNRPAGLWRRNIMRTVPSRLQRMESKLAAQQVDVYLLPVSIFWGRAANKDRSWIRALLSEGWAMSSRLRRLLILLFNRRDILVQIGEPLPWHELARTGKRPAPRGAAANASGSAADALAVRRTARLLRVKFRNQKVAALGPDLSHRRTLVGQILRSSAVSAAVDAEAADGARTHLERRARKAAQAIAADMSYPTVRFLNRLLAWFWHRVYSGIDVHGWENFTSLAETHTLVYAPCHRSHIDYLLLSYVLYHRGLMLPHIAAGDNLNMPVVGGLLRGGGAFFMRRRFGGDRLYQAVFAEYLYQVFRRGHSVEYFVEGGRSRTGRLLSARTGLLQMTLDAHRRGLPRPIAFVPVYFGYEKLIEATSYVEELRGAGKSRESVGGVLRSLKLVRESLGTAQVSFGRPVLLDDFLAGSPAAPARALGARLRAEINAGAAINGVNLIALATLSMPRQAIEEQALTAQIDLYRQLIRGEAAQHGYRVTGANAADIVQRAERLGLLRRERGAAGRNDPLGDILMHDDFTSVLMTWYRNNVLHVLAAPSFIACLVVNRRSGIRRDAIRQLFDLIFPYIRRELVLGGGDSAERWLDQLKTLGLVELRGAGFVAPQDSTRRFQLRLLANAVMQVLERFYITVSLLGDAGPGAIERRALLADCCATAERISTLYGINAPEYSDQRLFEGFAQGLMDSGVMAEDEAGKLHFDQRLTALSRAGHGVIAVELRQALERRRAAVRGQAEVGR